MIPMQEKRNAYLQIMLLWALNIFDAMFSGFGLYLDALTEDNPLLAAAWQFHPISFFATKFGLLLLGSGIVIHHWRERRMRAAIYTLNAIMLTVVLLEILHIPLFESVL